ncbi:MAG: hypothetical protein M3304_07215 [Actinomycetota bacterium]|nr:hypothetical protein [Actinomycetota bacterium]
MSRRRARVFSAYAAGRKSPARRRRDGPSSELDAGDENGLGSVYRHRWRSRLPYTVAFDMRTTRIEALFVLEGEAHGELEGVGRWRLYEGETSAVTYEWRVRTTRAWNPAP